MSSPKIIKFVDLEPPKDVKIHLWRQRPETGYQILDPYQDQKGVFYLGKDSDDVVVGHSEKKAPDQYITNVDKKLAWSLVPEEVPKTPEKSYYKRWEANLPSPTV